MQFPPIPKTVYFKNRQGQTSTPPFVIFFKYLPELRHIFANTLTSVFITGKNHSYCIVTCPPRYLGRYLLCSMLISYLPIYQSVSYCYHHGNPLNSSYFFYQKDNTICTCRVLITAFVHCSPNPISLWSMTMFTLTLYHLHGIFEIRLSAEIVLLLQRCHLKITT